MSQIGSNNLLNTPLDLNYGPDGYLWVTEKNDGIVVRIDLNTANRDVLITIPDAFSSGGQDGLLGLAFDAGFLSGSPYVYLSYSVGTSLNNVKQKLVRYTYSSNGNDGSLSSPLVLIENLPASNDHNSGKLVFGTDGKLYYTIGDQGNRDCSTNLAQFLPTQQEIDSEDWSKYPGKILRLNTDGSIPGDNPILNNVRSHIYSYGHRNPQGLVLGSNGVLYSSEHGPSSDDEVNIINSGKNYGWPYVAGLKDNLHDGAICNAANETAFTASNYQDPIMSMFVSTTPQDPNCTDSWMCRANIAPSGMDIYESNTIPSWKNSLLVTSLKRGRIYKLNLNENGTVVDQENITQHFYTQNRYRDIVVSPDGKSIYIITDSSGKTSDESSMNVVTSLDNPGSILRFAYDEALSIGENEFASTLKVWPNPAQHSLFIKLNEKYNKGFKAELINSVGQIVKQSEELKLGLNEIKIEGFPAGVYVLKLSSGNRFLQKQVVLY
ncbi:PQQ-dependent sugar dehydrogenase [Flavisericum labens]|uniref:PQQ-dependent sugar dehydrogenase n=1 Tax=Flavisericum labens TaxID=3377112 RepID=UPI00387B78A1